MSHFSLESTIDEIAKMDAPLERGPLLRWQRKAIEAGMRTMSVDGASKASTGGASVSASIGSVSPLRSPQVERLRSQSEKDGSRSQGKQNKTPGKHQGTSSKKSLGQRFRTKTPNKTPLADRFIPNRSSMDYEVGHYRLMSASDAAEADDVFENSETEYQKHVADALGANTSAKILAFSEKAPVAKEGTTGNAKVLYSSSVSGKSAPQSRVIPQRADRILDAPGLMDDYYLNLVNWSAADNVVALAMYDSVYLWNASSGSITELCELSGGDYYSSVSFMPATSDSIIAIGNSLGSVQIWDINQQRLVRTMAGHAARVGSLSWNYCHLTSGSRTGAIHQHDVRVASHHVGSFTAHTQEVCGLQWSNDGRYLASGANDNLLCIWDHAAISRETSPMLTFSQHQAAVKAVAWCPWQLSLLASGGGTADRQICMWNVATGACVQSTDTNSQVCSILWSQHYRELISGHGYSQNQLTIWKYPSMARIADLTGHTGRILGMAMSPDGTTVASIAADETLRFWKCFEVDKSRKESASNSKAKDSSGQQLDRLSRLR